MSDDAAELLKAAWEAGYVAGVAAGELRGFAQATATLENVARNAFVDGIEEAGRRAERFAVALARVREQKGEGLLGLLRALRPSPPPPIEALIRDPVPDPMEFLSRPVATGPVPEER